MFYHVALYFFTSKISETTGTFIGRKQTLQLAGKYILDIPPSPPGGTIFVQVENREEFEGRLHEEREGKRGGKKKKVIKHTLKYLYEA